VIERVFFVSWRGEILNLEVPLVAQLPQQMPLDDARRINRVGRTFKFIFTGGLGVVTNLILAIALQLVWKMLGTVQFIVHLPYTTIGFPPNASLAFAQVI